MMKNLILNWHKQPKKKKKFHLWSLDFEETTSKQVLILHITEQPTSVPAERRYWHQLSDQL